ncbi:hypothetical protein FM038_014045 [Shewanella eurypsychrophilus]|uniref:Lipoprotein n=1 Tax=Shewanella eurypsychrophilus TaxID=2593656 RepID=A0ABX6V763_9GAMM|nr:MULTISPECIES: hypothetical protein [Shewanella]QFU23156.1 hypothetical protein FS418_15625 [Shewanella sp. YLB-09]QPG58439.1 hypothetical protein FM038_014045 [Shewanella eurypsychrophilus]
MKKLILASLVALTALTGCVSNHTPTLPEVEVIKFPATKQVTKVSLGERMLESGKKITVDGFTLDDNVSIFDGVVMAGTYHKIGVKDEHTVYKPEHGYGTGIMSALGGASPAKPYIDGNTKNLCFFGSFGTAFCSEVKPRIKSISMYSTDSFIQELIYTGKVQNKVRFSYREYSNGTARQAFTVNVEYDLSESNIISYKGSNVEIIKASNNGIEYKVLNHFK